jgi:hypothetical protein
MPLPFILWGAAALLAGTGVVKGVGAISDFDEAKQIGESASNRYDKEQASLIRGREKTNSAFEELGKTKIAIFKDQISHLVAVIRKSKGASSRLRDFEEVISDNELKEMEDLILTSLEIEKGLGMGAVSGTLAALGAYGSVGLLASASTGTAISALSGVAATNATLAWLGGGALSAGGFGMAGGAIALGGIVLGPALAVGGFMIASQAEKALTQAYRYKADVDTAVAEMQKMSIVLTALQTNAIEVSTAIQQMAKRFDSIKVDDDSNKQAFERMLTVGKGLKALLDIAIMKQDGSATENIKAKTAGYLEI